MRNESATALAIAMTCGASTLATANTFTARPNQVPDEQQPSVITGDAPAGFGSDSWGDTADPATDAKVNWHARYNQNGDYLSALFPAKAATLTISDIESISYRTKSTGENWFLKVYTRPENDDESVLGTNDQAKWFGKVFTNNYSDITSDGTWQTWSTATGGTFDQDERGGQGSGSNYNTWSQMQSTYGSELVEMISVQTDSGVGRAGQMDGLVIQLTNEAGGATGSVNFEAVPEPAGVLLVALGGGILAMRRRRRGE